MGNPRQLGTQDKINSIKIHMVVMRPVWVVILELMLDMVDIICHSIKETSPRCITINFKIMISRMDTMAKVFTIEAVVEAVAIRIQDVVAADFIR